MARAFTRTVGIVLLCLCGKASWGLTRTFYYVGAPAQILNVPADEHALFNTGHLTITTDAPTLSGRSVICWSEVQDTCFNGDIVSKDIYFNRYTLWENSATLDFDATGLLSEWSFGFGCPGPCGPDPIVDNYSSAKYAFNGIGDRVQWTANYFFDTASRVARDHLTALGYVPGTSAYEALFCGSWAGPNERCGDYYGEPLASSAWITLLRAPVGGRWYDDPLDFAAAVQANTILALANPAKSYNDIAPVPLPASLLFLGSGVLVLLRIGQRRMSHASAGHARDTG